MFNVEIRSYILNFQFSISATDKIGKWTIIKHELEEGIFKTHRWNRL